MLRYVTERTVCCVVVVMWCALTSAVAFGATFYVDGSYNASTSGFGVDHFSTIQSAINAAVAGTDVVVNPGTYNETIDFGGKAITVQSTDPDDWSIVRSTIINGGASDSVVTFNSGEGSATVLAGFTIRNGNAEYGGGIRCGEPGAGQATPTIRNNIIRTCTADYGGGVFCDGSSGSGNGPTFLNNLIVGNAASFGGGVSWQHCSPTLTSNTIVGNKAKHTGGGIRAAASNSTVPVILNCILWGNVAPIGHGIWLGVPEGANPADATLTVEYSDVAGGEKSAFVQPGSAMTWDASNISTDPLFAETGDFEDGIWTYGDYHLQSPGGRWDDDANGGVGGWVLDSTISPCVDTGDPSSVYSNEPAVNGDRINMGAYGNTAQASRTDVPPPPEAVTISGRVRTSGGAGVQVTTVTANNGGGSAVTDANGYYELIVPYAWTGSVTPTKVGWTFVPEKMSYTNLASDLANQNFTGTRLPSPPALISGHVETPSGVGVQGVSVATDDGSDISTTDANGYYELIVSSGWSGVVTPSRVGWTFSPTSRSYSNLTTYQTNQDFTGTAPTAEPVAISGRIRDADGDGIQGVSVAADNSGGSSSTDANGDYDLMVPSGWSGTVTPSKLGWTFDPVNRSYSGVTTAQTNQDFTGTAPSTTAISISGQIRTSDATGVEDVTVSADSGGGSDTTDAEGNYELIVPYGWTGTVTPAKVAWTFDPSDRSYTALTSSQTGQNFTATEPSDPPVTISGRILDANGDGVEDVVVSADNGGGSDTTDSAGDYDVLVPYQWTGTVTPEKSGWTFDPTNRSYENVSADQTGQNFTGSSPDEASVSISGYVRTADGAGISGVSVSADNGGTSGTTNADGYYAVTVAVSWSGNVTPTLTGYTFDPVSQSYTNVTASQSNQNYTGIPDVAGGCCGGSVLLICAIVLSAFGLVKRPQD